MQDGAAGSGGQSPSLVPYAENARTHSPTQVAQIAASIAEFGFVNPVLVDAEGVLIAGHGRVMAAKQLGLATVPVLRLSSGQVVGLSVAVMSGAVSSAAGTAVPRIFAKRRPRSGGSSKSSRRLAASPTWRAAIRCA